MATSNVENLAPNVLRKISKEIAELISSPLEGIKVIPNERDVSDTQAIIEGPAGTPYQNGFFRVKLILGKCFPTTPPKGFFLTKIFHPNVSRTGEICVNTLKKDWNENLGLKHILLVIKCLLIVPNAESALNEDAAKLLLEDYDEYFRRAKMITEIHAIRPMDREKLQDICDYNNESTSRDSSIKPKSSTTNELMPLAKRPANQLNSSSSASTSSVAKQPRPIHKDPKKRTLRRL